MFEYFKRKFSRLENKFKITSYPQYYEENGLIIRENKDGSRYIVELDNEYKEKIIGEYHG